MSGPAFLADLGHHAGHGPAYRFGFREEVPVVRVAAVEGGDGAFQAGHRVVQRAGVARVGGVAAGHGQALGVADGEAGALDLLLGVLLHGVQAVQAVAGGRDGLVGGVQQGSYGRQQGRGVGPALLVAGGLGLGQFRLRLAYVLGGDIGDALQVLPAGHGEAAAQFAQDRLDLLGTGGEGLGTGAQGDQPVIDLGGALRQPLGLHTDRFGPAGDPLGPLQGLRYAVLPGALVQLGELGGQGGETGGEAVGLQPCRPYGVERVGGGEQGLAGALDRGGEAGQLGLGLAEQRAEALGEPVQLLLDPAELLLGGGQLAAGAGGGRGLQVVAVEVVGVDGVDVLVAGLVDAPAERVEVGDGAPGGGGGVDGGDRLDGDAQVALRGVELVEGGRGGVLRGLRLGSLALGPAAEPAPGAAAREGGGQRQRGQQGQPHQGERVTDRARSAGEAAARAVCARQRRRVRLRWSRRHIPLPCCGPPCPVSFSHRLRTNTRAG
ncbi:hypothetical protein SAFG77S_12915 [Streptomyces afghaniensis]